MTPTSADTLAARYRALFEATPDGILFVDGAGVYVDLNDAMCRMFGGTREELLGRHFAESVPEDRLDDAVRAFGELLSSGGLAVEFPIRRPDGTVVNLEWRSRANFVPGLHLCIAHDLSEREAAQRALRESDERYRAFMTNSSEAIWRFELEEPVPTGLPTEGQIDLCYEHGYLAECNDAMARMYGFGSSADIVGARLGDLLVRDNPENTEYLRAFIESGYRLTGAESHEVDRDGNEKVFVNSLVGIVEDGRILRAWGTQRDATEEKKLERERMALLARLEQANQAKDDFLAMLSHELRTPMTATLGWAGMLERGPVPEDVVAAAAQAIGQSTRAQARLIDDLLDVSRIVSGKMQLSLKPLLVAETINAAVETIRPAAEAKQIRLDVRMIDEDARLQGDHDRLQQVFWNLLSNAVKFTPRGGWIDVELLTEQENVRATVRDSGEGISRELLPHIFERFRQGDSGASRKHSGLGLGLSIARNLVELHGGTLTAASEGEGRGATFTVLLPGLVERRALSPPVKRTSAG